MHRPASRLLLLDREDYSAGILLDELRRKGFGEVVRVHDPAGIERGLADATPDVVIFNYHFHHKESLAECSRVKQLAPHTAIVAVVSAGPAMRLVRDWARETREIDVVIEKPLSDERFFLVLRDLADAKHASRTQQSRLERLSNLVPEGALSAIERSAREEAELFEAAVVFTDIRRSSRLITTLPPQDYFALLNRSLSAQAHVVEIHSGSVVKFTGDGLLAVFRGMGRAHLALRCALELAKPLAQEPLPFGVGAAQGLILAGFVGDSHAATRRRQYDVIGSTVHLAARLCSLAGDGEVVATRALHTAARLPAAPHHAIGPVAIRGFETGIECVSLGQRSLSETTARPSVP